MSIKLSKNCTPTNHFFSPSYLETPSTVVKFFLNINRFLRPKKTLGIDTLRVQADNSQLSIYAQTNFQHIIKDSSVIFTDPEDKLLIIGKYLESINSPRYTKTNTKTKKIVDIIVNNLRILKHKIKNKELTFTEFSPENPAYNPKKVVCRLNIFFKILDITTILAKLKIKASSGLDNIPTVVLKNLPLKLLMNYTIIFNNAINNAYYPSSTLVIPQKKTVKYLGVTLDYLLRLNKHHSIQLNKAKIAIKANSRIFYNSNLEARSKIICYPLLIRPILTYAVLVLWNMGSTVMEKYRRLTSSELTALSLNCAEVTMLITLRYTIQLSTSSAVLMKTTSQPYATVDISHLNCSLSVTKTD
ncbi:hypothetical protein M0802_015265 [Mischocyttarus mexicanus]|nr:hypothetical protein M0802_015265 [Mischocyttarus mexicanus]